MINRKPSILVSGHIKDDTAIEIAEGRQPRVDYFELSKKINGDVISYKIYNNKLLEVCRKLENIFSFDILQAIHAFKNRKQVSVFFSTSEKVGFPLSFLLNVSNCKVPHIMIGHQLSNKRKKNLYRFINVFASINKIICLCKSQAEYLTDKLEIESSKIEFIHDKVDNIFFNPGYSFEGEYLLSVGKESRDYITLFKALAGIDVPLKIVASSLWNKNNVNINNENQSINVTYYSNCSFLKLRELYGKALFVVVSLKKADYAAGVNVILESMAMGKAVIASRSQGIQDYVEDGVTGLFVEPGDINDLSMKIKYLLDNPEFAKKMGEAGRKRVEKDINIDVYIEKLSKIIQELR